MEGDSKSSKRQWGSQAFLSTPSGWRATPGRDPGCGQHTHFYPRPPGGGRPQPAPEQLQARAISIHALRVEGDVYIKVRNILCKHFYPRPPGGGRLDALQRFGIRLLFLSTPSGWRATPRSQARLGLLQDFYPRPPGGGRQAYLHGFAFWRVISIHALRVEGDSATIPFSNVAP